MKKTDIKLYNRQIFSKYIRDEYINNKCEICGATEKLELHHNIPFDNLLRTAIKLLNYKYYNDTEHYTKQELENIKLILIGLQVTSKFTTLCDECHDKIHSDKYYLFSISNIKRIKRKINMDENINTILLPYIEKIVNKKIYTEEDKNNLKDMFVAVGIRGSTLGINTLNDFLNESNINYQIHSKREYRRNNEFYKKHYWEIVSI